MDATNNLVMFTDATKTYKTKIGGKTINETENTDYVISFMDGKNCYVNVKFVKKYVDFDYKVVKAEENLLQELFLNTHQARKIR